MRVEFKGSEGLLAEPAPLPGRSRERGVGARLVTQLQALAEGHAVLAAHRQRPWSSITFSGVHHALTFRFTGPDGIAAGERLIAEVGEHEFAIPRHLVADVTIAAVDQVMLPEPRLTVQLEVLTLEDG